MSLFFSNKDVAVQQGVYGNDTELGKIIEEYIVKSETAIQNSLEEMYSNMSQETLRSMRRVMPVTRMKMDWNIDSVRMTRQVGMK